MDTVKSVADYCNDKLQAVYEYDVIEFLNYASKIKRNIIIHNQKVQMEMIKLKQKNRR